MADTYARFQGNDLISFNGVETYGLWVPPAFIDDPSSLSDDDVTLYYVTNGVQFRPDLISQEIYGTPYLDWVLLAFNDVFDTVNWPAAGTVIKAPAPSVIFSSIQ